MYIRESAENYLETILLLRERNGKVRSIDIVNETGFSKPSISVAMKKLREEDLIKMDKEGLITLSKKGDKIAKQVYERHTIIHDWLISLGVSEECAEDDACHMEHILHDETFEALKKYIESK